MDIGAVIKGSFEHQDWLKQLLLVGVVNVLICATIIGIFVGVPNLMGWGKSYARELAAGGTTLPEFGFGCIGDGYRVIAGMIVLGIIATLDAIPVVVITVVLGKIAGPLAIVRSLLMIAHSIVLAPVAGIITGRIYLDDDMMAGTGIVSAIMQVKDNIGAKAMFVVTLIVLGFVSAAMGVVPAIGSTFGAAFQGAAGALAIVQFRQALDSP
jgi:hypothetical protein